MLSRKLRGVCLPSEERKGVLSAPQRAEAPTSAARPYTAHGNFNRNCLLHQKGN